MSNQLNVSAPVECGACKETNSAEAKYCAGCGGSLVEPCAKCAKPVLLTQKFCADCGTDLTAVLEKNQKQHQQWMADAVSQAKQCNYDTAIALLHRVTKSADFRYGSTLAKAEDAVAKIKKLKKQKVGSATAVQEQAEAAFVRADFAAVIKLLSGIPESLLSSESERRLEDAKSQLREHAALHTALQESLKGNDWQLAGGLVQPLLHMMPGNASYQRVAKRVSEKLIAGALKCGQTNQYDTMLEWLHGVPECNRNQEFVAMVESAEDILCLERQFDNEAFATPMLSRLAVRFANDSPGNPVAHELVAELTKAVRHKPIERNLFPVWRDQKTSAFGGKVGLLGAPSKVDLSKFKEHRKYPGQFNVALGLSLQGLGLSRITESFVVNKKSLLSSLSRKKVESVWGIDVGSTMLRAVRLEVTPEGVNVADLHVAELDSASCRKGTAQKEDAVRELLKSFVEKHEQSMAGNPVWVNMPTTGVVHRFTCLPPVKDRQAAQLLETEASQKIPLPNDEVQLVRWMAGYNEGDPGAGRPAMIAAARKTFVERRLKVFADVGLQVAGMQCDTAALANFACFEFGDDLSVDELVCDEQASKRSPATAASRPGVMLLDCGAAATNVVIVSSNAVFLSCYEQGGEDLTTAIARCETVTHADADRLKRDPARFMRPSVVIDLLEKRMAESRQRLERIVTDAKRQNLKCDVIQTWCAGGGALCHGWVRSVLQD